MPVVQPNVTAPVNLIETGSKYDVRRRLKCRNHMRKLQRTLKMTKLVVYSETLIDFEEHLWTFIGAFVGIGLIGYIQNSYLPVNDNSFLIGSFGASAVLIYGVINSPLAQPRNLIGGHVISAFLGVTVNHLVPVPWLAAALAVSTSIVAMQVTKTLHPPGGATALIAVIGSKEIKSLGYRYVFNPILTGVMILLMVALFVNNITANRSYPKNKHWFKVWTRKYVPLRIKPLRTVRTFLKRILKVREGESFWQ
jgi:CBS-domain-containing membrane protein